MSAKYPVILNLRITNEDWKFLSQISLQLDTPRAALMRRALRELVKSETEKSAS